MAVDRGGLRYTISVRDTFSTPIRKFRSDLVKARQSFRDFRRDVGRGAGTLTSLSTGFQKTTTTVADLNAEIRALRDASNRSTARQIRDQQRLRRGIGRTVSELKKTNTELRLIRANSQRNITVINRMGREGERAGRRGEQAARRFNLQLRQTQSAGSRLLFTFRRLVGVLAAFTLAREATSQFADLIRQGVRFNQTIQQSNLGLAGIIVATAQVSDAQGRLLRDAEAFEEALGLARNQQEQIRRDALRTQATFTELLDVFQIAVGPGLAQGLRLDEVRELSVLISQAASSIGLAQNQLSEEIRALLTGQIRPQTTRIAQVLQISNEDIRRAREQGQLFEFLQDRLASFGTAAERAARTLGGLTARIRGAVEEIAGAAAIETFENLTTTLQRLLDVLLVEIPTETGTLLRPDPRALAVLQQIFNGIERGINQVVIALNSISFNDIFAGATALGTALEVIGAILGGLVQGAVRVVATLTRIVTVFNDSIGGIDLDKVREVAALVGSTLTTLVTISAVTALLRVGFGLLVVPLRLVKAGIDLIAGSLRVVRFLFTTISGRILLIVGIGVALVAVFKQWVDEVAGFEVKLTTVFRILREGFFNVLTLIAASLKLAFDTVVQGTRVVISELFLFLLQQSANAIGDIANAIGVLLPATSATLQEIEASLRSGAAFFQQQVAEGEASLKRSRDLVKDIADQTIQDFDTALLEDDQAQSLKEVLNGVLDEVNTQITELFGDDFANKVAAGLQAAIDKITPPDIPEQLGDTAPRGEPATQADRDRLRILTQRSSTAALEAAQLQEVVRLEREGATAAQQGLAAERAKLATITLQRGILIENLQAERARTEEALKGVSGGEKEVVLKQQLSMLNTRIASEEALTNALLEQQNQKLREQQLILEGTLGEGFRRGLQNFAERFASAFEAGVRIAEGILNRFASFVSRTVVDAFDPTKDFDIKERFARFLQEIAALVIQQLTQIAIAKAILGLGLGLSGGGSVGIGLTRGGQVPGLSRGGRVPGYDVGGKIAATRAWAGPAHYGLGGTPPSNVSPKDTQPIWAQPGEFMQPVETVRAYGLEVMEALRRRLIDPMAIKSLVGVRKLRSVRRAGQAGPGFQEGGLIGESIRQVDASLQRQAEAAGTEDGAAPAQAFIVANNQTLDTLLGGGVDAFRRFLRDNAEDFDGILRGGRTGG